MAMRHARANNAQADGRETTLSEGVLPKPRHDVMMLHKWYCWE